MNKIFTFRYFGWVLTGIFLCVFQAAKAVYTPVTLTGFKADVIANGIGLPTTSTTLAFDSASATLNYVLIAQNYQQTAASPLPTAPYYLPTTGTLSSATTTGLNYQLASYSGLNSLRLAGTASPANTGILTFPLPNTLIGDVYILGSTGSGTATVSAIITFTDNTTQSATSTFVFNDWFTTTPTPAVSGFSRALRGTGAIDANAGPNGNPRFFEWKIPLLFSNYTKTIKSVTITRTTGSATTSVLNIMAITVDHQPCLPISGTPTMTGANFTWNANTGSTGYEWAVTTTATPPSSGTNTATTNSAGATGLNNGTTYWFHVRNKCSGTSFSIWNSIQFQTLACPIVPAANINITATTTVSANLSWTAVSGSGGYDVGHNTSSTVPPTSFTTQTSTTYSATGLLPGTTYYLWVRNKCASPSNSVWIAKSFTTSPCPSAGTPTITNNVPGSVSFTWTGTTTPGVANYQWAVTPTSALPTSWNSTSGFTATMNGLIAGSNYFIHVRSNCTNTQSAYTALPFVNPFPPCAQPGTLSISAVNMHGADIKWTSSANVVNGYQYALTTSATPPTTGLILTSDTNFSAINLVGGQKYYFYVRTHCGANLATPPVSNLSAWKIDSFTTPLTCLSSSNATITNVTSNSADIVWTKYPGIYGYEYVMNSSATPPPANFAGVAINFNTLAPVNLQSGTNYYFHLRIRCDTFNYSPWTSTPFSTQSICSSTPSAPTLIGITPTTAHFSWTGVAGALQYQYCVTPTNVPDPNSNTYTSQTNAKALLLNPNSPYYFHVRAYCSPNDLSNWESVPFSTVSVSVNYISAGNGFDVIAYPNPVKDVLRIEISGEMKGKGRAILYDLSGKMLRQMELKDATGELNMSDLAQGMYLLKYRDDEIAATMRVQKL
ncbi:MAG TPA: T9SS type A sorting domain-containing protein [Flavipsychrobacter sp.]|nr:T9SS type A sorting domain-containing protein [Flavipsychrobacter sp.]